MTTRSPLIWFGGKSRMAKKIIGHMAPHKCYVELFGGAAHVIAQKEPMQTEVYNDIDCEVVNFIMVTRSDIERFIASVDTLPYSRSLYESWIREPLPVDEFTRAVRWFYCNRCGIAKGNATSKTGWRHAASSGSSPAPAYYSSIQVIRDFTKRMRGVQIECRDFREVISIYDTPDTLFYVDPPYVGREKYYAGGFKTQDHIELAMMLNGIQGKAIVSYYEDNSLLNLYEKWEKIYIDGYVQSVGGSGPRKSEEILFMNYDPIKQMILEI